MYRGKDYLGEGKFRILEKGLQRLLSGKKVPFDLQYIIFD